MACALTCQGSHLPVLQLARQPHEPPDGVHDVAGAGLQRSGAVSRVAGRLLRVEQRCRLLVQRLRQPRERPLPQRRRQAGSPEMGIMKPELLWDCQRGGRHGCAGNSSAVLCKSELCRVHVLQTALCSCLNGACLLAKCSSCWAMSFPVCSFSRKALMSSSSSSARENAACFFTYDIDYARFCLAARQPAENSIGRPVAQHQ